MPLTKFSDNTSDASSPETQNINHEAQLAVNVNYQYTSDDMKRAIQAELHKRKYYFANSQQYVLKNLFKDAPYKQLFHIVLTDCVDSTGLHSTPIDYFLNKQNQPSSYPHQLLDVLLPSLNKIKALADEEQKVSCIQELIGVFLDEEEEESNKVLCKSLLNQIEEHQYNSTLLKKSIEESLTATTHDVFDEIMPLLMGDTPNPVKILFAYNVNHRQADEEAVGGHWLTVEIHLAKKQSKYRVIVMAHDPYGEGNLAPNDQKRLEESIKQRLGNFHPNDSVAIVFMKSPYRGKRQADSTSCGAIVVEELFNRLEGKNLSACYPAGCQTLRIAQYQSMKANGVSGQALSHFLISPEVQPEKAIDLMGFASLEVNIEQLQCIDAAKQQAQLEAPPEKVSDSMVFALLGVDIEQLQYIDAAKQQAHLHYKYLLAEMEWSALCRAHELSEKIVLKRLDDYYERAQNLLKQIPVNIKRSPHSVGLNDLILRRAYQSGNLRASLKKTADKNKGVEPGFEAILVEDVLLHLEKAYPDRKTRLDYYQSKQYDLEKIYQDVVALPKYLVKLDYKMNFFGRVEPRKANLKNASFIQRIHKVNENLSDIVVQGYKYYKISTAQKINCAAVLEVLANDIARASGMSVQEQTLYKSFYQNGQLKLMAKGKWLENTRSLGPFAGDNQGGQDYRVIPTLSNEEGIQFVVNRSIPHLGRHWATLLIQQDYDAFGKSGDNKLEINHELVGIDFGHAYSEKNTLIQTLLPNLHLPVEMLKKYSHFSICYEARRSELMEGVLIYAKLAGKTLSDELLKQYGASFQEKIAKIEALSIQKIINDYLQTFTDLKQKEPQHAQDYEAILQAIEAMSGHVEDAIKQLLQKVGDEAIFLPPALHDFLEQLEYASLGASQTSLRSPDGRVLLGHLRLIDEGKRVSWSVSITEKGYQFSALFPNEQEANKARNNLLKVSGNKGYTIHQKALKFSCSKEEFPSLQALFNEEQVKLLLHSKDSSLFSFLEKEARLNACCQMGHQLFSASVIKLEKKLNEKGTYVLTIAPNEEGNKSEAFELKILEAYATKPNHSSIEVTPENIDSIIKTLEDYYQETLAARKSKAAMLDEQKINCLKDEITEPAPVLVIDPIPQGEIELQSFKKPSDEERIRNAIKEGQQALLNLLLVISKRPTINQAIDATTGDTPLHLAIREGQLEIVEYLIHRMNASPFVKNKKGETALSLVWNKHDFACLDLIQKKLNEHSFFNHPAYQGLQSFLQIVEGYEKELHHYGSKLKQRKEMYLFIRFLLGYHTHLEDRFNEYSALLANLLAAAEEFNVFKLYDQVLQEKRGLLGRSELHDRIVKQFRIHLSQQFDSTGLQEKLMEAKKVYDSKLSDLQIQQQAMREEVQGVREVQEESSKKIEESSKKIAESSQEIAKLKNDNKLLNQRLEQLEDLMKKSQQNQHSQDQSEDKSSQGAGSFPQGLRSTFFRME